MRRAVIALLAVLAVLAGCDDGGGDGSGLVFKDPTGTVEVEAGMEFSLEFSVNASVGYDWELVDGAPGPVIEPVATEVDYPNPDSAGDSGTKRFVFKAKRGGLRRVELRKLYRGDEQERRLVVIRVRRD